MNIVLLFLEVILSSIILVFFFKKYKYDGIYIIILLLSTILGIISIKTVEIFELEINLGFAINMLIIIASNIIVQKKGPDEISKVITMIILSNIIIYTFSILASIMNFSNINEFANKSFEQLFYLNNRIYFASIVSLVISLYLNSILYHQIRQIKNKIWISNTLSTIIINFIECTLFCIISYTFKIPLLNIIELIVIRYLFKTIIGLAETSLIYIANSIER